MGVLKLGCSVSSSILLVVFASGCSTISALDFSIPGSKSYAKELHSRQKEAEVDRQKEREIWNKSAKASPWILSLEKAIPDDVLVIEYDPKTGVLTGR